jgi:hypothetical protein
MLEVLKRMNPHLWVNCRCITAFPPVSVIFWREIVVTIIMFLTFYILREHIPISLANYECHGCFVEMPPTPEAGLILKQAHACVSFYLIYFTHTVRQKNVSEEFNWFQ